MGPLNVVFDLDGTLVDSARDILDALRLAVAEAGIHSNIPLTSAVIGPPVRGMLKAWGAELSTEQANQAIQSFRRIYDSSPMQHTVPYPGVDRCLRQLTARGHRLFVATNKPEQPTLSLIRRYFDGHFAGSCSTNSLAGQRLDKTGILSELTRRHGLSPRNSVMIGDNESDLRAGKTLGWRTMAVLYGYGTKSALLDEAPQWAVATPEEIAEALR